MKKVLLLIGLGQIGTSIGLALEDQKKYIQRIGYDKDPHAMRQAWKQKALDDIVEDMAASIPRADMVLLSIPMDELEPMIETIAPYMKPGAVLMETSPVKEPVAAWAEAYLPPGCHYVGLTPVLNPRYLVTESSGVEAAEADLFQNGMMTIAASPQSSSEAIKMVADLVRLLGAAPTFTDMVEIDGLMTATHIVPQLMSAALLNATVGQPGWREARRMAGRAFAEVSGPIVHLGEPGALATTVTLNQENSLRVLNTVIAAMQALRDDIENCDNQSLTDRLERARQGREIWWEERQQAFNRNGRTPKRISAASDVFGSLLRFGHRPDVDED